MMKTVAWVGVILVASVMVLGLVLTPGLVSRVAPSSAPATPACAFGTDVPCAMSGSSSAAAGIQPAIGPSYNSLVSPYASFTGPYSYVAGGAAMRDQGYGSIDLTWTGSMVSAFMVWSIINNSVPASTATLNGVPITGTWVAYATPSPCWGFTYIYTFVADVTPYVNNGVNTLTNFPTGVTNGLDPWGSGTYVPPLLEGASLVVVNQSAAPGVHQVTLYTGAFTEFDGGSITAPINYTAAISTAATTTFIVSDGQLPGNSASWNGAVIDSNAFPGSDPRVSTATWSYGNLYDTKTYAVSVGIGSTTTPAAIAGGGDDCLTWDAQVLNVQVAPTTGPYTATFAEAGLPVSTTWTVSVGGTHMSGTVGPSGSDINFTLPNGAYTYSVTPVPGYATPILSGGFAIAGGNFYLSIPFHPGQQVEATLDTLEPAWNSGNLCTSILNPAPGDVTCTSLVSQAPTPLWYNFSAGNVQGGTVTVAVYGSADCINLNFHSFYSTIDIVLLGSDYSCAGFSSASPAPGSPAGVNVVVNSEGDSFNLNQLGSYYDTNVTIYGTTTYASTVMDGSNLNTTNTYIGWSPSTNTCPSGITDGRVAWSEVSFGSFNTFNTVFVDGTNVHVAPPNYAYSTEPLLPPDGYGYAYSDLYGNETTQTSPVGACSYLGE